MDNQANQGQSGMQQEIAAASAPAQDKGQQSEYAQIASIISDLDRRLRTLEERYGNLRKKIQLTDQNLIDSERSFGKELRHFNDEILEVKRNTNDFSEKILIFDTEIQNTASKTDMKIIEKYLALWNPTSFVTRKELKDYLESKYGKDKENNSEE